MEEFIDDFYIIVGVTGLGLTLLSPILTLLLPFWSTSNSFFLLGLSISLWMTTFLMLALARMGGYRLQAFLHRISAEIYNAQTQSIRNNDKIGYFFGRLRLKIIYGLYYSLIFIIPICALIYSNFFISEKTIIAFIPLIIHIILTLLSIPASGLIGIVLGTCSIAAILILWFNPNFHPLFIISSYITTGQVVIAGISINSG